MRSRTPSIHPPEPMFSETAELYDVVYGQFKDYSGEAARIHELIEHFRPSATRVLDVGCGTGEHARILAAEFGYIVDGLDLQLEFVEIAQQKSPNAEFFHADMLDFSLDRRYDVILCLFSSIGYARTVEGVRRSLARMRDHLSPGGVLILEPWFQPENWEEGFVHASVAEADSIKVCRMSHSRVRDGISVLEFHYLIGEAGGVEHRMETHELGLFTLDEMKSAFDDAGLEIIHYDPVGLIGRGLFVAGTRLE